MQTYIINLQEDILKKQTFLSLNHHKMHNGYKFIDAIDGKLLDKEAVGYNRNKAIKYLHREMGAGEIGCYLSHMKIYQDIVEKNISKALIFEDDIKIIDDNFQKIVNIVSQKEYFDICLLAYHYKKRDDIGNMFYERLDETHNMLKISKREWGGYGYIITNKACQKLLKYKNDIFLPVDTLGRDTHFDKFLDVYCVHPSLIEVNTKNSRLNKERIECTKASNKNIFKRFFS